MNTPRVSLVSGLIGILVGLIGLCTSSCANSIHG